MAEITQLSLRAAPSSITPLERAVPADHISAPPPPPSLSLRDQAAIQVRTELAIA